MSENQTVVNSNEIDLLQLFGQMFQWIKNVFFGLLRFIFGTVIYSLRRFYIFLAFLLLGGIVGWINFNFSRQYYSAEMIASVIPVNSIEATMYVGDLQKLIDEEGYESFCRQTKLSLETARQIKKIEAFLFYDTNGDKIADLVDYKNTVDKSDTTIKVIIDKIALVAEVYNTFVVDSIELGIKYFFGNHSYLKIKHEMVKNQLSESIDRLKRQIDILDSLQQFQYFDRDKQYKLDKEQVVFINESENQLYYKDIFLLESQLQELQNRELLASRPFYVLSSFNIGEKPVNHLGAYLMRYAIWSLFVAFFLIIGLKYKIHIVDFVKKIQ